MKPRKELYDTYWYLAAERQKIFFKRIAGDKPPYSSDPILQEFKFANAYRASDRVSQFLIKEVIYSHNFSPRDTVFRTIFFRLFNKIETWERIEHKLRDSIAAGNFDVNIYSDIIKDIILSNSPIYGNAFILCANKAFGFNKKYMNHLALLEKIEKESILEKIQHSQSLKEIYEILIKLPLIGEFMAYQLAVDINYSDIFKFSENSFTKAGPGAKRGIKKVFTDKGGMSDEEIIIRMVEIQDVEFSRLNLDFKDLWGRKLHAIDCQGLFCETDKYSRARFPELKVQRSRIKQRFIQSPKKIKFFYPPWWELEGKVKII